jgi:hypothetical protein
MFTKINLPTSEIINRLFDIFPIIGYGDSQCIALINRDSRIANFPRDIIYSSPILCRN